MSFRNRPVLDRRHRPRWQDELRVQQLVVATFALAIALAIGIFGATAWNAYWDAHLRPVAAVSGTTFLRSELNAREVVMEAELTARAVELQSQLGGPRDALVQQELEALSFQLQSLTTTASDTLVQGAVLASQADAYAIDVSEADVDAEVARRRTLPERARLQLIVIEPPGEEPEATPAEEPEATPTEEPEATPAEEPEATPAEDEPETDEPAEPEEPTEEELAAAREEAEAVLERIEDGAEFTEVAAEVSDDFTAQTGGELGWIEADDLLYAEYFEATREAEADEIVGPIETEGAFALVKAVERREPAEDEFFSGLLERSAAGAEAYASYVRDSLLLEAFRAHFAEEVAISPQPQRRVAQIFIAAAEGEPLPQQRARHILIQPLPEEEDQAAATDEQWDAALEQAEEVREELSAEGADWFALAEEHSQDPGSQANGGDLGWFDPSASGFVEPFAEATAGLEVGELSEPVRTDFGYHLIQLIGERTSPQAQAAELVEELRADPDSFAEVATRVSQDHATAREEGDLGWVAPYELPEDREEVLFGLTEVDEISEPVDLGAEGIYIFKLLETSDSREVPDDRLEQIRSGGFERWLETEVEADVPVWVDPAFASTAA